MKKVLLSLLLAALLVGAWIWHGHRAPADAPDEDAKPTAQVQVAPLQTREISQTLPAFGVVEAAPAGIRALTLAYDCVVRSVAAPTGTRVAAGGLILEVGPTPDAQLQLDSARATAEAAAKGLASAQERFDLRLANAQDLLVAKQAADDARLKLASYQSRMAEADGRITSAVDGVVTRLDWQPGTTVAAGTVLAVVGASGQLEAHLTVEAAAAGMVHAGESVNLTPANRPDAAPATGVVRLVGGSVDPVTGAVDVRVPLPAAANWLLGEHVQGAIETQRKTALVAPRSAVLPDDDKFILFTVKDGKATKHEVQTGIGDDQGVEVITSDLRTGDLAVTLGNYELDDGMAVQVGVPGAKSDAAKDDRGDAPAAGQDAAPKAADAPTPEAKP